mgnify:CR=1 FL=1
MIVLEQESTIIHLLLLYKVLEDDINHKTSKTRIKLSPVLKKAEVEGLI